MSEMGKWYLMTPPIGQWSPPRPFGKAAGPFRPPLPLRAQGGRGIYRKHCSAKLWNKHQCTKNNFAVQKAGRCMQNFGILTQNLCNATKKNGNAKLSKKQNACNAGFVHIDCAGGITLQCNTIFLAVQKKKCSAMVWLCCHFGSSEEIATAMLASPDTHLQRQPHGSLRPLARFKHRRTKRHNISARTSTPLKGVNSE